ncbi:MAG: hypothetical protein WC734_03635 [Patescibacteria group bacterium]
MISLRRILLCCTMTVVALTGIGMLTIAPHAAQAASVSPSSPVQIAASDYGLSNDVATDAGLPSKGLKPTVLAVIKWILGFLGVIGVILVVYAGFLWMTAAGNDEQISKAKGIITAAIIGLIIVILAFAIVQFVLGGVNTATNT